MYRFADNHACSTQRGAVLVISLILLIVLTLLGLTTMNTSTLQEKMASNSQEAVRAFQAAESGISAAFSNAGNFNLSTQKTGGDDVPDGARYDFISDYIGSSVPPRGSKWDAEYFSFYHFNIASSGEGHAGSATVVNAGVYVVGAK